MERQTKGDHVLSVGQVEIRTLIEKLTGTPIASPEWKLVWQRLQDGLSQMFMAQGAHVIDAVASILEGESHTAAHSSLIDHIDAIAAQIERLPGNGSHAAEMAQAVRDMFAERDSPAFLWLVDLCSVYIDMCSLGLETHSQEQIVTILKTIVLLLDTDITLSLLSEGEGNHVEVEETLAGWRRIGGTIATCVPVLEECAHHAWISNIDFEGNERRLAKMSDDEALREIENVFVRGYRRAARGKVSRRGWEYYITAFRGSSDHDYDKILGLLVDSGLEFATEDVQNLQLLERVERQLVSLRTSGSSNDTHRIRATKEKCNRDARMATLLVGLRTSLTGDGQTAAIVSTSRAVREAIGLCGSDGRQPGPEPVIYLSGVAWLLSLVPGAKLSVGALKGVLFDDAIRKRFPRLERHVMRIVQASTEYSLHWSRRSTLYKAVRSQLGVFASRRGEPQRDTEQVALSGSEEGNHILTQVIAEAVDQLSRSRSEEENARLQFRVEELERLLEVERRKRREGL